MIRTSLKRRFIIAIGALYLVTAVAAAIIFLFTIDGITREYVDRFAVSRNLLERSRILTVVERDAALSLKLADDPAVIQWMNNPDDGDAERAAAAQLDSYRRLFSDNSYFVAIAETLAYYVETPQTTGRELTVMERDDPRDRWFFATLESDRDFWINVDYNAFLQEVRVWINSLVRDSDGTTIGAAGTGLDLSEVLDALVAEGGSGVTSVVVNGDAQILAHPDRSIIDHNARVSRDEDRIDLPSLLSRAEDRVRLEEAFSTVGPTPLTLPLEVGGASVTASVGHIPELDWYNLVLVDDKQIMGARDFLPLFAMMILSLLALAGIVVLLLDRQILRPLGRLAAAALQVADGNFDVELDRSRADEIGNVSDTFIRMTEQVGNYTENLEREVAERTRELRQSRERILESIRYGKLIQDSVMPSRTDRELHFRDSFIIHRPLDTVGGDFAFVRPTEDGFCAAVVDCTGHGIPGAFMTMLVGAQLNRVIETSRVNTLPKEMLVRLHQYVQDSLRGSDDVAHLDNGFDIALCRYRESTGTIDFSGAGLPLLYRAGSEVTHIGGDRVRLGFRSTQRTPSLSNTKVPVSEDSVFYLFSDGVLDLPGGKRGYGLGRRRLGEILHATCTLPVSEQENAVRRALDDYRGELRPKDDMILLAFSPILRETGRDT